MIYENWMRTHSLNLKSVVCPPLEGNLKCDCLVVGGGFAGLHAALRLVDSGKDVILLEKGVCGNSSSGQSAGFLTPESEEDVGQIISRYGEKKGKIIYSIPLKGMQMIVGNAKKYGFNCDLRKQDSFYFTTKKGDIEFIKEEAGCNIDTGMPASIMAQMILKKVITKPGSYSPEDIVPPAAFFKELRKRKLLVYENGKVIN